MHKRWVGGGALPNEETYFSKKTLWVPRGLFQYNDPGGPAGITLQEYQYATLVSLHNTKTNLRQETFYETNSFQDNTKMRNNAIRARHSQKQLKTTHLTYNF